MAAMEQAIGYWLPRRGGLAGSRIPASAVEPTYR